MAHSSRVCLSGAFQKVVVRLVCESYIYDTVGRLTSKTDRKGQVINSVYDALDRRVPHPFTLISDFEELGCRTLPFREGASSPSATTI